MNILSLTEIGLIIVVIGLCIGWYSAWSAKEYYRCRVFELSNGKEGSNLVTVKPTIPPPEPPRKPPRKGPRFEWDDDDGCWVLKDCVRVDGGTCSYNVEPYYQYYNITAKKSKSTHEAKTKTT